MRFFCKLNAPEPNMVLGKKRPGKKRTGNKRTEKKRTGNKRIRKRAHAEKKRIRKQAQIKLYQQIIIFVYCGISVSYNCKYENVCYLITNFSLSGIREDTSKTTGVY